MSPGFVIWLTGLSGAGKSTLAQRLRQELLTAGRTVEILDGDEVRKNLSAGLGFSKEDRDTNVRRLGYVAGLIARSGGIAIVAAISPYRAVRDEVHSGIPRFVEVYVRCSIRELSRRDVKGLYAKALAGEIAHFTGVSDPYEEPLEPRVTVDSERQTIEQSLDAVLHALERLGMVPASSSSAGAVAPTYPVALDLAGRKAVVIGDGPIAVDKARGLVEAGAAVTVVAAAPGADLEELAASQPVTLLRRGYWPGDLDGAAVAFDASDDEWTHTTCAREARANGVLLNVVDRPEFCDFHAPALVRRGPVRIAISTSGESPAVASALRARLERFVGEEWEPLTRLVGRTRRTLREQHVSRSRQERAYRRLLRPELRSLLRSRRRAEAASLAAETTAEALRGAGTGTGRVALVGAGPGDPGLLTLQAFDLLASADVVLHDALIPQSTLRFCGDHAEIIDAGKRHSRPGCDQGEINAMMIAFARQGLDVVRLKGGDPFVFGRGGEEMAALVDAGIDVIVVPGVSSALAAPEAAGIPVTLRGVASSVGIVSGHPRSPDDRPRELARLRTVAAACDTLVVLMPLTGLADIVAALTPVVGGDRMAALVSSATWEQQRTVTAPLHHIQGAASAAGIEAPATLVVGDVVALAGAAGAVALASTASPESAALPA